MSSAHYARRVDSAEEARARGLLIVRVGQHPKRVMPTSLWWVALRAPPIDIHTARSPHATPEQDGSGHRREGAYFAQPSKLISCLKSSTCIYLANSA